MLRVANCFQRKPMQFSTTLQRRGHESIELLTINMFVGRTSQVLVLPLTLIRFCEGICFWLTLLPEEFGPISMIYSVMPRSSVRLFPEPNVVPALRPDRECKREIVRRTAYHCHPHWQRTD